jgi:hypothetical protein
MNTENDLIRRGDALKICDDLMEKYAAAVYDKSAVKTFTKDTPTREQNAAKVYCAGEIHEAVAAIPAVTPDLCADARSRPDQEISKLHSRIAVLEADGIAARKAAAENYARAEAAEAQLADRDAAIASAYEAAAGLVHRIADGYSSSGYKDIACALYLTEGNVRALTPSDALAALERVKAEARGEVEGLVEALRAIAETSNYTRASWMQDTARAALAAWEGRE